MNCEDHETIAEERRAFDGFAERLRSGENLAAQELLAKYSKRIVALARQRLNGRFSSKIDPDDVLQSVFRTFFRRLGHGDLDLRDWSSLTGLLSLLTLRKCQHKARALTTAKRDPSLEVSLVVTEGERFELAIPARDPTPDEVAAFTELLEYVLSTVETREREILELILAGQTVEEVASRIKRSRRTVQRSLAHVRQSLIRDQKLTSYLQSPLREGS